LKSALKSQHKPAIYRLYAAIFIMLYIIYKINAPVKVIFIENILVFLLQYKKKTMLEIDDIN